MRTESSDEEELDPRQTATEWKKLEAQRALSTVLEATRMLRISNLESLRIQRNAREFAAKDGGTQLSEDGPERRTRAFALLAGFFHEAVLQFQESMQAATENDGSTPRSFQVAAQRAVGCSFGFLTRSDLALALPLDPRAQTLRAAVVMDSNAVRDMLEDQVAKRIECAINLVVLGACVRGADVTVEDGAHALENTVQTLLTAFAALDAGLRDSFAARDGG